MEMVSMDVAIAAMRVYLVVGGALGAIAGIAGTLLFLEFVRRPRSWSNEFLPASGRANTGPVAGRVITVRPTSDPQPGWSVNAREARHCPRSSTGESK
jgi:hypothetical protein